MEEQAGLSSSAADFSEKWIFSWLFISCGVVMTSGYFHQIISSPKKLSLTHSNRSRSFFPLFVGNAMQHSTFRLVCWRSSICIKAYSKIYGNEKYSLHVVFKIFSCESREKGFMMFGLVISFARGWKIVWLNESRDWQ
jgi:hypothetical protein